jgi:hypothetical protein
MRFWPCLQNGSPTLNEQSVGSMQFEFANDKTAEVPLENIARSGSQFLKQLVCALQEEKKPLFCSLKQFPLVHAMHCVEFLQHFSGSFEVKDLKWTSTRLCHIVDAKCAEWFNNIVYNVLKGNVPELTAFNNVADQLHLSGILELIALKMCMAVLELRFNPEQEVLMFRGVLPIPPEQVDVQKQLNVLQFGA